MASIPAAAAAAAELANPKRPAADVMVPLPGEDEDACKRRRTEDPAMPLADAAALNLKIATLEAAVARGRAREAALDARIAELETRNKRVTELEADNASLAAEVTELRLRPRPPPPPATLRHLIRLLGSHERDLPDLVFELVRPRHLAACQSELPETPGGLLGEFAVTVPTGTIRVYEDAFTGCEGLAQIKLPATVTVIEAGTFVVAPTTTTATTKRWTRERSTVTFRGARPCARSRYRQRSPRSDSAPSSGARPWAR